MDQARTEVENPVDHSLSLRQDWRKGCCVFCPSRSVEWIVNKGHHLGSCHQSHHTGLLELLTLRCLAAFSPALQKDTHPITGDPWTLRAPMSEQYPEATYSNDPSVLHHPQKDPLTQTKSFRTSRDLCFLWENLTGPGRGPSGSTIGAKALASHRTHA